MKKCMISVFGAAAIIFITGVVCAFQSNTEAEPSLLACKKAYEGFLEKIPSPINNMNLMYSFRDLNGDGVPELLVVQSDEEGGTLTVYSYGGDDGNVYKIGDYSDSKVGISEFVVSDKPEYPGLFHCWWGGGVEHYGYLSVEGNQLLYRELYVIDRTGDVPRQRNSSGDKELMDEAVKVFAEGDSKADNLLDMHLFDLAGYSAPTDKNSVNPKVEISLKEDENQNYFLSGKTYRGEPFVINQINIALRPWEISRNK